MGTAYASNAIGDWATSTRWTPNGIPGNGDTASNTHALTISDSRIIGTSPVAGTVVFSSTATVTVQNGGFLTLRGDATLANVAFTGDQGSIFEFDSHLAVSPSTTSYKMVVGTANGQANAYYNTTGITGNPAIVRSNAGGANGFFSDGGFSRGGKAQCAGTSFLRIGDATNRAFAPDMASGGNDSYTFDNCTFDTCGGLGTQGVDDHSTIRLSHVTFKNSLSQTQISANAPITAGERSFKFVTFDLQPQFFPPGNFTVEDCLMLEVPDMTAAAWASWKRNLIQISSGNSLTGLADIVDCYLYMNDGGTPNQHYLAPEGTLPGFNIIGTCFELSGTDDNGDCILSPARSDPATYKVTYCIILPNAGGFESGCITIFGDAFTTWYLEHNTQWASGGTPGVSLEETSSGRIDQLKSYRSNMVYGKSGDTGRKITNQAIPQPGTTDMVRGENCDCNGGFQLTKGRKGNGYDAPMTNAPGAHDVVGDPRFVDSTRNIAKWDLSLGGPGTAAHAFAELAKMNDFTGYNTAYTYAALRAYVIAGFAPQNPDYANAAHDGGDIGAVPVVGANRMLRRGRRVIAPLARVG